MSHIQKIVDDLHKKFDETNNDVFLVFQYRITPDAFALALKSVGNEDVVTTEQKAILWDSLFEMLGAEYNDGSFAVVDVEES